MKETSQKNITDYLLISMFGEKYYLLARRFFLTVGFFVSVITFIYLILFIQKVPSESMEPTFYPGDIVITNKFVSEDNDYQRGDIISFCEKRKNKLNLCDGDTLVKRIVGLPGETIEFKDGDMYINNKLVTLETKILKDDGSMDAITLKENEYFVSGDNREESFDSRQFGPIDKKQILGQTMKLSEFKDFLLNKFFNHDKK